MGNKHLDMARGDKGTGRTPSMQWTGGQGSSQGGERLAPGDRALRLQATTGGQGLSWRHQQPPPLWRSK